MAKFEDCKQEWRVATREWLAVVPRGSRWDGYLVPKGSDPAKAIRRSRRSALAKKAKNVAAAARALATAVLLDQVLNAVLGQAADMFEEDPDPGTEMQIEIVGRINRLLSDRKAAAAQKAREKAEDIARQTEIREALQQILDVAGVLHSKAAVKILRSAISNGAIKTETAHELCGNRAARGLAALVEVGMLRPRGSGKSQRGVFEPTEKGFGLGPKLPSV